MARSKEQWKAQQRALHTQSQSKSFVQMQRPLSHTPGARPTAPPVSSALFQLGRPTTGNPVIAAAVLKSEPIQTLSQRGSTSGQAIDLTLDDEDDEEDEPMGTQRSVSVAAATGTAATASSTTPDAMLDSNSNEDAVIAQSRHETPDMMVPEDIESDVDEDWPIVPSLTSSPMPSSLASPVHDLATSSTSQVVPSPTITRMSEQASHSHTQKDVGEALDAVCKTIPFSHDEQEGNDLERSTQMEATRQQTSKPPLYGDGDDGMDVDGDIPTQAQEAREVATDPPSTTDRIVEVENLEDGEIFEEEAVPKPTKQVQQAMMRENRTGQFDAYYVDSMGIRPNQRAKKQKKRGKKKSKRKLEAMQLMHTPPGEVIPDFERTTRQRPFAGAPPPGQYTLAMMRNDPKNNSINIRPVFQDPPPAPFQPGRPVVGGMYPPMRPPPQQRQNPPMPPPPPYDDSQILRVNRQGGMEMLGGEAERSRHAMFSEPPTQGGFKYRSVSITAPRPMLGGAIHPFQRSVSDQSRLPPIPHQSRASTSSQVPNKERNDSEDFDLDSLRAAALRSKVNRTLKTSPSKPTAPAVTEVDSSSSSSLSSLSPSRPTLEEDKRSLSEPASPNSENELRLEILRSMTRNRKRAVDKAPDDAQVPTPPDGESNAVGSFEQSSSAKETGDNGVNVANENPSAAQTDPTAAEESSKVSQPKTNDTDTPDAERMVIEASSSETDNSTATPEQDGEDDKAASPSASAVESTKPSAKPVVTTPKFRPLTACSQSLVITLSPEDFSSHKGGDDTRTKPTLSSSLQDAIKEMRRKIAEREKEQTSRLLENAAAQVPKHPSGSSSSPASLSSTPHQLSPKKKGVSTTAINGNVRTEPPTENPGSTDASIPGKDELDFDAIRAEYEQCVTKIEEADTQIALLSDEMAQLQKLLPVESTMREG